MANPSSQDVESAFAQIVSGFAQGDRERTLAHSYSLGRSYAELRMSGINVSMELDEQVLFGFLMVEHLTAYPDDFGADVGVRLRQDARRRVKELRGE
jgi:hypothetical protein